jgi:hypothetical protein
MQNLQPEPWSVVNRPQLYSLVEQRDLRVQSSIARAAQRDSEDMKFLAIMGSIFLPASLVAVSEQFANAGEATDQFRRPYSTSQSFNSRWALLFSVHIWV